MTTVKKKRPRETRFVRACAVREVAVPYLRNRRDIDVGPFKLMLTHWEEIHRGRGAVLDVFRERKVMSIEWWPDGRAKIINFQPGDWDDELLGTLAAMAAGTSTGSN